MGARKIGKRHRGVEPNIARFRKRLAAVRVERTNDGHFYTLPRVSRWQHNPFYDTPEWRAKRDEVLRRDHGECYYCRLRGHYSPAVIVHHVLHLEDRPDLALSDTYTDEHGKEHRQLVSVCRDCHETVCHPRRLRAGAPKEPPITEERWD